MAERFQLPPVVTASDWSTLERALWEQSRGVARDDAGEPAPTLTNREAMAVIDGMRRLGPPFPLWYQFAAVAYGWAPDSDELDATSAQGDREYPLESASQLATELHRLTVELGQAGTRDPRIDLDDGAFALRRLLDETRTALRQDGATAPAFKIPLPACRDPRTGRPARPVRDPKTGKYVCPGGVVTIDDPLTHLLKAAAPWALFAFAVASAVGIVGKKRRRRRK